MCFEYQHVRLITLIFQIELSRYYLFAISFILLLYFWTKSFGRLPITMHGIPYMLLRHL